MRSRRASVRCAIDAQCRPSRGLENAAYLVKSFSLVWKELQSKLTENDVKVVTREWQIDSATRDPDDCRSLSRHASGNSQHPDVQVEASDLPPTNSFCRQTRHNA